MMLLFCAFFSTAGNAESQSHQYIPGLGEYMMTNQAHHLKLWFAGANKNWELADYELDEIVETLEDIVQYQPNFDKKPLSKLIPAYTSKPIEELKLTIRDKNVDKFTKAYDGLTNACNACHQATGHRFILIQRPTTPAYTNQKY